MANVERKDPGVHQENIRLNKFLAVSGIGSRRSNDELILSGAVSVNGKVVRELGSRVNLHVDKVRVNGKRVNPAQRHIYVLLNKPKDAITTLRDEKGRTTVMEYVRLRDRVFPVGRLDRNTTGVLIFTNDGRLANAMMHPRYAVQKVYRVTLGQAFSDEHLRRLKQGINLEDGPARAEQVQVVPGSQRTKILISIREGRNREVRRMFESLGYDLRYLERVSIAGISTRGLPRGKWRYLSNKEVKHLKEQVGLATDGRGDQNEEN